MNQSIKHINIKLYYFLIIILPILFLTNCFCFKSKQVIEYLPKYKEIPQIRICLARHQKEIKVSCSNDFNICYANSHKLIANAKKDEKWTFRLASDLHLEIINPLNKIIKRIPYPIQLIPLNPSEDYFIIKQGKYKGLLEVAKEEHTDDLLLINQLSLEIYLEGVIPYEIGFLDEDKIEALKAQSIAARTYALKHQGKYSNYDLSATTSDQVYKGCIKEHTLIKSAIKQTEGVVLTHNNEYIESVYHSTCGGHTASSENVWQTALPCLKGTSDKHKGKALCSESKYFQWDERWHREELEKILAIHLPSYVNNFQGIGTLKDIKIVTRSNSGRVTELKFITSITDYTVYNDKIRFVLRPRADRILRSTKFKLKFSRKNGKLKNIYARGYGNGHGVGMCQVGSIEMATIGYDYIKILEHYYSDVELKKIY